MKRTLQKNVTKGKRKLRIRINANVTRHTGKEENNYSRFGATLSHVILDGGHVSNLDKLIQVSVCLVLPLHILRKLVVVLSSPVLEHARFVHRHYRLKDGIILEQGETCVTLIILQQGETFVTFIILREKHV